MLIRHSLKLDPKKRPVIYQAYGHLQNAAGGNIDNLRALKIAQRQNTYAPIILQHSQAVERAVHDFLSTFSGDIMYTVKANRSVALLRLLWDHGIRSFNVLSIAEIREVRKLFPTARLNFMNPVKNEMVIQEAYRAHGVRTFSLDTEDELHKILRATQWAGEHAKDLTLCVRIAVESHGSVMPLSEKFGIAGRKAEILLTQARKAADQLGICFHVGSQCMRPETYEDAVGVASTIAAGAGVTVDFLDFGGGIPVAYPGMCPPQNRQFSSRAIHAVKQHPQFWTSTIWWEPGRPLSACFESLILRVELVKARRIHSNDGLYGRLHDAVRHGWKFEMVLLRESPSSATPAVYSLAGPTMDSDDIWHGACSLPSDVCIGDYIWVKNIGAYGTALSTHFDDYLGDIQRLDFDQEPFGEL